MLFTTCTLLIGAWIWLCIYTWINALNDETPRFPAAHHRAGPSWAPSVFETLHDRITDFAVSIIFFLSILCGVAAFFIITGVMWSGDTFTVGRYGLNGRRGIMARARRLIFSYLGLALRSLLAFRRIITGAYGHNRVLLLLSLLGSSRSLTILTSSLLQAATNYSASLFHSLF